jgi:hypothetical protein
LRRSANIVVKAEKCERAAIRRPPCGQEITSSFYRPRGGDLQSCHTAISATYGSMACGVVEVTIVLANLAPGRCCGESCTRLEAASRVAAWKLPVLSLSACYLEGSADGRL